MNNLPLGTVTRVLIDEWYDVSEWGTAGASTTTYSFRPIIGKLRVERRDPNEEALWGGPRGWTEYVSADYVLTGPHSAIRSYQVDCPQKPDNKAPDAIS